MSCLPGSGTLPPPPPTPGPTVVCSLAPHALWLRQCKYCSLRQGRKIHHRWGDTCLPGLFRKIKCGVGRAGLSVAWLLCPVPRGKALQEAPGCPHPAPLRPSPTCTRGTFHGPGFPLGVPAPKRSGKIIGGKPFACGTLPRRVNPTPPREGSS